MKARRKPPDLAERIWARVLSLVKSDGPYPLRRAQQAEPRAAILAAIREEIAKVALLVLVLAMSACGGNPKPQPPGSSPAASPSPVAPSPAPPVSSPRPPRPEPEPPADTPLVPEEDGLVSICHVEQPAGEQDRFRLTMRLSPERARHHLERHDRDTRGKCE